MTKNLDEIWVESKVSDGDNTHKRANMGTTQRSILRVALRRTFSSVGGSFSSSMSGLGVKLPDTFGARGWKLSGLTETDIGYDKRRRDGKIRRHLVLNF
jgi:hypothetical protein